MTNVRTLPCIGAQLRRCIALSLCLVVTLGCQSAPTPADEPEDEDADVGALTSALSLVSHRTLEIEQWTYPAPVQKTTTRVPALSNYLSTIMSACALEVHALQTPNVPTTSTCKSIRSPTLSVNSNLVSDWPITAPVTASAAVCAAHWALTIAEGTKPVYVGIYAPPTGPVTYPWIGLEPDVGPEPLKVLMGSAGVDPARMTVSIVLKPASPTDAPTWALLATELFREAAVLSSQLLDPAQCPPADINRVVNTRNSNEPINLMDYIASTLVDATQSMIEASEKAQELVIAASALRRGSATDFEGAAIQEWRARSESRLEAIDVVVPVSEYAFQGRAAVPLWQMTGTDYYSSYYSTMPELPQAATGTAGLYNTGRVLGYVQSTDYPPVGSTRTLTSYRKSNGIVITTDQAASWAELGTGVTTLRREGYSRQAAQIGVVAFTQYRTGGTGTTTDPYRYRWVGPSESTTGYTTTNNTLYLNTYPFTVAQTHSWQYPIVTLLPETAGAKRVEDILRSTRIDPRITGSRTVDHVATDILYSMQNRYPTLYDTSTATALLDKLAITKADVERSAAYIVQVNRALGRAIIDDAANPGAPPGEQNGLFVPGKPKLVLGTGWPSEGTHPAIIYARTGGRFEFPTYPQANYTALGGTAGTPGPAYARSSIIAALDYVRWLTANPNSGEFDATDYDTRYTDSTRKLLKMILAWTNAFSGARVRATMSDAGLSTGTQVASVELLIGGLGYTAVDLAQSELEFWLGEDGLECALGGRIGGAPCDRTKYVFPGQSWAIGAAADADVAKRGAVLVTLNRSQSPLIISGSPVFSIDIPVFLVRTVAGKRSVVTAFYPVQPRDSASLGSIWLTPFGDYTAKVLSAGLGVNPQDPEKAATSCAGIPTNTKVKLEDELTEAVAGQDDIESSFAHYLRRAREAATRADALGDELITQGLEMDRIAEDARDSLEDLCGGVINVGRLEAYACGGTSGANCDVAKLLDNPAVITDGTVRSDVEGLRRCLGVQNEPINAVLGKAPMCVWQASKTVGAAVQKYPTCVCPGGANVCKNLECVTKPMSNGQCDPVSTGDGLTINWTLTDTLNMSAGGDDALLDATKPNTFRCGNLLALRAHIDAHGPQAGIDFKKKDQWDSLSWVDQDELYRIATTIGFEYDQYLFPTVTAGGNVLVQVGSKENGPASPSTSFPLRRADWLRWPCSPHPLLDPANPGRDTVGAAYCASGNDSLLCGGHCGETSWTEAKRAHEQATDLARRLRNAVQVMKGLSGASFTNYQRVFKDSYEYLPFDGGMLHTGSLPSWHPFAPSNSASVSRDGSKMCWWLGSEAECAERRFGDSSLMLRIPERGSWYGGFPVDPHFAWSTASTCEITANIDELDGRVDPENCGDMRRFLKGQTSTVNLQYHACPNIPDDLCLFGTCGTAVRRNWDEVEYMARQEFTQEMINFIGCAGVTAPYFYTAIDNADHVLFEEMLWDAYNDEETREACSAKPTREEVEFAIGIKMADDLLSYDCFPEPALPGETYDVYDAPIVGSAIPSRIVLDALDLACVARTEQSMGCDTLLAENYPISDVTDFTTMTEMVGCAATRVESNLQKMLVVGIPESVADDIAARGPVQVYPSNRGEYGKTVALLAAELVAMRRHGDSVVQAIRDMELSLKRSRVELNVLGFERNIKDIELYIEGLKAKQVDVDAEIKAVRMNQVISSNLMECAATMSRAFGDWTRYAFGQGAGEHQGALITCANLVMQNQAEREIGDLNGQLTELDKQIIDHAKLAIAEGQKITDEQKQLVLLDVAAGFNATMDKINEALIALQSSHALVQGYLADLDVQRNQARRLAASVLMLNTDEVGRQYVVNTGMRARMNTLLARYKRARGDAIRASYLARLGVEQKLGVDLSAMTTDMTGVPAPSTWADKLCSMSGIDYARIRSGKTVTGEPAKVTPESIPNAYDYSDGYVGDYVTRLENFVDAYRIDYPFQDGDGLAVVSLRDEVLNVRRSDGECPEVEGPNLLYYTDGKTRELDPERGWQFPCATAGQLGNELNMAPVPEVSPFSCGTDVNCANTSELQAFTLTATPANSCLALPAGDEGTPVSAAEKIGYHLRGTHCGAGFTPYCQDLSGRGAAVTAFASTYPTVITTAVEIARLPALRATNGSGLKVDANLASTSAYSVLVSAGLMGAAATSQGYTLWSANTAGTGSEGKMTLSLQVTSGTARVKAVQSVWPAGSPQMPTHYTVEGTLPNATGPWAIGLRASATAGRMELWLNGRPLATNAAAVVQATNLDAISTVTVDAGNTASLLVSDLRAYEQWLTDGELSGLQNDTAGAHGLAGSVPNLLVSDVPTAQQEVVLAPGAYLLSWYQYIGMAPVATSAAGVRVHDGDFELDFTPAVNTAGARMAIATDQEPSILPGWVRYFGTIDVDQHGLITIGFTLPSGQTSMTMAGPQLESISSLGSFFPEPFFPTGSTLAAQRTTCEDTYGDKFRSSEYWTYGCEPFCPPGSGLDCGANGDLSGLPQACFYETTFGLSLEEIEKGNLLQQAGFARGNFNYRFNGIAVNIVGTAVKNCELSANPSSCYTNNNLLYSLRQDEPFRIRNYDGDVLHAALYPGNIQQAQALLAERVITNPISSADRNLLTDYWRGEFKGRPMDGNFRLRIYETEGLDWRALEDVQLVLDYRYWTRER